MIEVVFGERSGSGIVVAQWGRHIIFFCIGLNGNCIYSSGIPICD
ncbi:hypothetical protein [Mucilaginibacter sp. FT3.2]|nr:hypothetical protein [Mucilaginibacter sp. FT3.2]MBB6233844.1 hypothetical protein [Mucilaginibacter sp. FT3.2]